MKLERMSEIETNCFKIGDQIHVGHYTATCQEITSIAAIFLLDQYLDEAYPMNRKNTNKGGYEKSDLRETLRSKEILDLFDDWGDRMVPFDNGDLLRIPFAGEMFDNNDRDDFVEPDGNEQWPLMKDAHNRTASRCGEPEWGWLQNKVRDTLTDFCVVYYGGYASGWGASSVIGVRPVFMISLKKEDMMTKDTIKDVLDTFNEKQRFVLYCIVGEAFEGKETILDVLNTFNEKQRLVLNYLVNKAAKDALIDVTNESFGGYMNSEVRREMLSRLSKDLNERFGRKETK